MVNEIAKHVESLLLAQGLPPKRVEKRLMRRAYSWHQMQRMLGGLGRFVLSEIPGADAGIAPKQEESKI